MGTLRSVFFNNQISTSITVLAIAYFGFQGYNWYENWSLKRDAELKTKAVIERCVDREDNIQEIKREVEDAQADPSDYTFANQ